MSDDGTITLVPSVHFSETHRRRVRATIRETDPDLVAVELDETRFDRLEQNDRPKPKELAQELPPATAVAYRAMQAIQRTVVRLYGLDPGQTDMEAAIETAAERDTDVALIDEPIVETITELSSRLGPETLPKIALRMGAMGPEEYVNQVDMLALPLKDVHHGDDVQPAIDHLRWLLPEVATVLIDRRDRAMAERLDVLRRDGYDVVAVIGAGHHNGVERILDELEMRAADGSPATTVPIRSPARSVTRIPIQ
ncbi:TraB domain-containing protein [Natrinema halophilum]|uniref:TraB/GumN family protein n=1 Tax=Natrinema halophilum TaxID=1699371 RepID=A0A7D5K932_9EURY|nr:TraB/GumN family protein [Natrinema halophilum]QLG51243.1 TraB/GumN family protein [Natrinema halophilum]